MAKRGASTVHGTEHLCLCRECGKVGITHDTINVAGAEGTTPTHWHPKCFFDQFGVIGVLQHLSPNEQAKFRICDAPSSVIRAMLRLRK